MDHDPVLFNDWLPVLNAADLAPGTLEAVQLLDQRIVVWRTAAGLLRAGEDRCPHRGAALSLGAVRGEILQCPYHGWRYDDVGICVYMPAHPDLTPPKAARLTLYQTTEKYGVIWVCLGEPGGPVDFFPEYEEAGVRLSHLAPRIVETSAPRLVENFLDMAHFPFVHGGILGQQPHTEVKDYQVESSADGVVATGCFFWQPLATPTLGGGADIEYVYKVRRPLLATLNKVSKDSGGRLSIMLVISPLEETRCKAWLVSVFHDDQTTSDEELYRFNEEIFLQDVPIVESQQPKRLPLDLNREAHQRADRMASAYRRWLKEKGLRYGTC